MLSRGRSWSRIWQIWGKSLIDDTDMGSSGERRNHQFSLPINITLGGRMPRYQNLISLKIPWIFLATHSSLLKAYAPPYRCFLWKQRLGVDLCSESLYIRLSTTSPISSQSTGLLCSEYSDSWKIPWKGQHFQTHFVQWSAMFIEHKYALTPFYFLFCSASCLVSLRPGGNFQICAWRVQHFQPHLQCNVDAMRSTHFTSSSELPHV